MFRGQPNRDDGARRWSDEEVKVRVDPMAPRALLRRDDGHAAAGSGREVAAERMIRPETDRSVQMRMRRIVYSLGWLAALALAVGASWRPWD
jgi:hypothetical protein